VAGFAPVIPPGGSGKVLAKAVSGGGAARWAKTVLVETDAAGAERLLLRFMYRTQPAVEVLPAPMVNLTTLQGESVSAELLLRRNDGHPLRASASVAGSAGIAVAWDQVLVAEAGADPVGPPARPGDWRARIRLEDTAAPGQHQALLRIRTDHPLQPEIAVPVRVGVRPAS
jgi:hypothetical protein